MMMNGLWSEMGTAFDEISVDGVIDKAEFTSLLAIMGASPLPILALCLRTAPLYH